MKRVIEFLFPFRTRTNRWLKRLDGHIQRQQTEIFELRNVIWRAEKAAIRASHRGRGLRCTICEATADSRHDFPHREACPFAKPTRRPKRTLPDNKKARTGYAVTSHEPSGGDWTARSIGQGFVSGRD